MPTHGCVLLLFCLNVVLKQLFDLRNFRLQKVVVDAGVTDRGWRTRCVGLDPFLFLLDWAVEVLPKEPRYCLERRVCLLEELSLLAANFVWCIA